jgi:anti-sigma-K factor RskA
MILDDDHIVLAAEYVLGTLDADETVRAEQLLAAEPDFAVAVREWERRIGELSAMVDPVEPPAELLAQIQARLRETPQNSAIHLPDAATARIRLASAPQLEMPRRPLRAVPPPPATGGAAAAPDQSARIAVLSESVRRWRSAGTGFGAIAAALAAVFVTSIIRPDVLPSPLRPKMQTVEVVKTVEKVVEKPADKPNRFVAVLQRDSISPAFILTVDLENKSMTVRRVAAETPAGKSYELWLVSAKYPAPKSLGVVGNGEFSKPAELASYEPDTIHDATYAVTLEPEGGSPTGQATGPILWTGKLIEAAPPDPKP